MIARLDMTRVGKYWIILSEIKKIRNMHRFTMMAMITRLFGEKLIQVDRER